MDSLVSNHFPLPHVPVIINQLANRNLLIEKAMVDTGSQISIANYDYVKRHRFIDSSRIRPMLHNCSLKSATGKSINPFIGKIDLDVRFIDKRGKTSKKVPIEFHVLSKDNNLDNILLGLNFLFPFVSEIKLNSSFINVKIDKYSYSVPLIKENHRSFTMLSKFFNL